jgi:hypothetical protein
VGEDIDEPNAFRCQPVKVRGNGVRVAKTAKGWAHVLACDPKEVGALWKLHCSITPFSDFTNIATPTKPFTNSRRFIDAHLASSRVNPCWLNFWFRFARFNYKRFEPFTQLRGDLTIFPTTRQVHQFERVGIKVIKLPLNIPIA